MKGKEMFNYEAAGERSPEKEKDIQETLVKVLQVIVGLIMALLHM